MRYLELTGVRPRTDATMFRYACYYSDKAKIVNVATWANQARSTLPPGIFLASVAYGDHNLVYRMSYEIFHRCGVQPSHLWPIVICMAKSWEELPVPITTRAREQ